ncbi:MAG: hypothetical protein HW394_1571, partial [Acidobacteria bacterium]|nr:hypothetical protein [Acidobacteriota bacterium]
VGERRRVRDPRAWLRGQLEGGAPVTSAPAAGSPAAIGDAIRAFRMAAQANRPQRQTQQPPPPQPPQAQPPPQAPQPQQMPQRQQARRRLVEITAAESLAALTTRVTSERPFVERLVAFWSNHLCVSTAAKVLVAPLAGSYERDAIRPHVLGRFEDMVLASAQHPAMLVYLDNFQSIGPNSPGAERRRGRGQRGLNENYARELLELHTLGVNGGYTQQDVQELAKILTGWTVAGLQPASALGLRRDANGGPTIGFAFQQPLHEPGTRQVLGVRYTEAGVAQGDRAIRDLCRHPATAHFIATKLVVHFVADDPPAAAVDRIARVFRATDGDLRAVAAALIDLQEAWNEDTRKFRTPQDWFVAVLRAFNVSEVGEMTLPVLRQLRHPLWSPQAPRGFGDSVQEWADPDSLLNRAELARTLARRMRDSQETGTPSIDPLALLDVVDAADNDPLRRLLADTSVAAADRVALAIAGPAFQWR